MESKHRVADTTGERRVHTTIALARLVRKAEEPEKEKRAYDKRPAVYLEAVSYRWVVLPNKACDLDDRGIVAVRVGPAYPRPDTRLRSGHDEIRSQRNGPEYLDGADGHQADVSPTAETRGSLHQLAKLTLAIVERVSGCDWGKSEPGHQRAQEKPEYSPQ